MRFTFASEFLRKQGGLFEFNIKKAVLNTDFPMHSHEFNELFIITKGTARHTINKQENILSPGDVFVIKDPNIRHGFTDPKQLEIYNFSFSSDFLGEIGEDLLQMPGFQALFALNARSIVGNNNYIRLSIKNRSDIVSIAESILQEFLTKASGHETIIKSCFTAIIVKLCREYQATSNKTTPQKLDQFGKAMAFIEKHYSSPIQLKEIAQVAAVSERHLVRMFNESFHITPKRYINQLRLNKAMYLLNINTLPIKEIAFMCGFNDVNYFSTRFLSFTGKTPSQYRKLKR